MQDPRTGGGRGLRRGIQPHGLADGLAGHQEGPAVGSRPGHECADPVDLRLPPDQIRGLAAIALPFASCGTWVPAMGAGSDARPLRAEPAV